MKHKHLVFSRLLLLGALSLSLLLFVGCSRKTQDQASSFVNDVVDDVSNVVNDVTDGVSNAVNDIMGDQSSRLNDGTTHDSQNSRPRDDSHIQTPTTGASDESSHAPSSKVQISEEEAKRIALDKVGVAESDVNHFSISLDFDDSHAIPKYDVEYYVGQTQYTFEIDARDGSITEFEMEEEN